MHTAADLHARIAQALETISPLAQRADHTATDRALAELAVTGRLDALSLEFLRRARDLALTTTRAVSTMTDTAQPAHERGRQQRDASVIDLEATQTDTGPRHPTTIDAADAWRRAHHHLPTHHDHPVLIHIQEFEDGYQAIPIQVAIPEPPLTPTIETATTLVIDKTTGAVTRWPQLSLDVLARQYRRYLRQEPMTLDGHPRGS